MRKYFFLLLTCLLVACATSPLGRSQLILFPEGDMERMGTAAFEEVEKKTPRSREGETIEYVRCVAFAVVRVLPPPYSYAAWEIVVFAEDPANAFALPGAKIGVYEGLLKVAANQDQLATVIGHEIAHVIAQHSNERISRDYATQASLDIIGAIAGGEGELAMAALGVGVQVGVKLPFNRSQESEADLLGLDYMADAGFDPEESIALWHNMSVASKRNPPEFLSTHPSHESRIEQLRARMPHALAIYDAAVASGREPNCD